MNESIKFEEDTKKLLLNRTGKAEVFSLLQLITTLTF
jgi:hypothetical protein